jgi:hypothetical protein
MRERVPWIVLALVLASAGASVSFTGHQAGPLAGDAPEPLRNPALSLRPSLELYFHEGGPDYNGQAWQSRGQGIPWYPGGGQLTDMAGVVLARAPRASAHG